MRPGTVLIDHTTSSPDLAKRIAAEAAKKEVASLDAPVSGGDIGAKNGQLVVMVGGEAAAVERSRPLMAVYSREIQNMGPAGAG
jgi:3-hydroxyisobutyrate dehydrogenase